jgi:hypothetical protein
MQFLIQGVSGGIVNVLGGGSMDCSEFIHMNICQIFNGCGNTAVSSYPYRSDGGGSFGKKDAHGLPARWSPCTL